MELKFFRFDVDPDGVNFGDGNVIFRPGHISASEWTDFWSEVKHWHDDNRPKHHKLMAA